LADLNIKKGHNIRISGVPLNEVQKGTKPKTVAIQPIDFRTLRPKVVVKEGDSVKIGSPLLHCKMHTNVFWPSPGAGTVSSIQFGPRRAIEKIIIELSETEESECNDSYPSSEIPTLGKEQILSSLLKGNMIPFIRQRPFNRVINPSDTPRDIFISGWNTAPLSVNLDVALRRRLPQFQAGINILKQLTSGAVHLSINENTVSDTLLEINGAEIHTINGPHPAGNVGIQIHHIAPLKLNDLVWTVNAQDVARIGSFFLTGRYDPTLFVTVGGPGVKVPTHIKTRAGVQLESILSDNLNKGKQRIISGDVLTGKTADNNGYLGFYDSTVSVIPEGGEREFMGMIRPGSSSTRYSLTHSFIGFGKKLFSFNTLQNGSERYMIPINAWEDVLPMDILPNALYRAILMEDIEEMEQLGILECDEEDFALCSFACPSKIDVGETIRHGLELMEKDG
jgi:Na+-transporting NADH:ubiquinone oxidoreductase subunit A